MNNQGLSCAVGCWLVALLGGVLAAALLMAVGGWTFMQGVFVGLLVFLVAGALLSWILCRPLPAPNEATIGGETAPVAAKSAEASSPSGGAASGAAAATATAAAAATASESAAEVKPSAELPGEEDLAGRKGEWRYEGGDEDASADAVTPAKAAEPAAAPAAPAAESTPDYDGDGVREGSEEGSRPAALDGPRDGKADNLKEIKGIGPKLEILCNTLGFYHFDQIASWTQDEVAWVNANLEGFKGRVSRDNWVEQAKILAAGGDTEFSKKVEKGGVYD